MIDAEVFQTSSSMFFLIWGGVLVFSMHAGFAFLEAGLVRKKNVVNAFNKILTEWLVAGVGYFVLGYGIAHGIYFVLMDVGAIEKAGLQYNLAHYFFMLTFATAAIAIISGGVAERVSFRAHIIAAVFVTSLIYPLFEGLVWDSNAIFGNPLGGDSGLLARLFGAPFHDFAGSVVVHAIGGWLALPAIYILGPRIGRFVNGEVKEFPIHSVPYVALGSWFLAIGWYGFNVASAGALDALNLGLVAANSTLAMAGGGLAAALLSRNDPGFLHNGVLAGLVAVCAGSDIYHPLGALVVGAVAGAIFVWGFRFEIEVLKIDDVLGVWVLHGLAGAWGGIATGIFGLQMLGGAGGVSFLSQLVGTLIAVVYALAAATILYKAIDISVGLRAKEEDELRGLDIAYHRTDAYPEEAVLR
ncbi:ammonium transporter [Candidatus Pyrohabitans sp.]